MSMSFPIVWCSTALTLGQLRQALADFHAEVPAGAFTTGEFDRQIRNESKLRGVEDIREAIVTSEEGRVIRVRDVAQVVDTHRKVKKPGATQWPKVGYDCGQ